MKFLFVILLFLSSVLFAQNNPNETKLELEKDDLRREQLEKYVNSLKEIESEISKENVWIKSYASYLTYMDVRASLNKIKKRIRYLKKRAKTASQRDELNALISKEKILTAQIGKLKEKDSAPFSKLITPPDIEDTPSISNPFDIFNGISLIKTYNSEFNEYVERKTELMDLISVLKQEEEFYKKIKLLDKDGKYKNEISFKTKRLERLETALDTMLETAELYQKRLEIVEININKDIKIQVIKLAKIGVVILVVFVIFLLLKLIIKKYITDNERFYMANKILTFINVNIILLILFFNYIENASYLVTILGFASAGIAIAMKDWFMSILGWLVIVFGGSIHVGDRIRVDMDGMRYVGDVMDISLLRMTILEDITLTSIMKNRRAGRIIFVPNNYVFTRMIANYTHSSLKTVWDGVKITITFESNHKKATHIVKEITKKFSKGYTDMTRKQLNKLRHQYSLKNTNVEPRIYSFIEPYGIDVEAWYLTNAYATLTLRSVISTEIIDAFKNEDDITIAYPTQKLHISDERRAQMNTEQEIV